MRLDWVKLALLLITGCSSKPLAPDNGATADGGENAMGSPPLAAEPQTLRVIDARVISSDPEAENFQQVGAEVDFGAMQVASATLRARWSRRVSRSAGGSSKASQKDRTGRRAATPSIARSR
jgi:hypothetical protein